MVIHGAIDGHLRKILYLKCTNNNKATTTVSYFSHPFFSDLPEKIRSDKGRENTEVLLFMLQHRREHSCVITGSSTHNVNVWARFIYCIT